MEALQQENEQLKKELAEAKSKQTHSTVPKLLYLTRECKQPILFGRPVKDGDPDVDQWIDDVQDHLKSLDTVQAKVDYIIDHLGGKAKDEIRVRPESDRQNPVKIFCILRARFGNRDSAVKLQ